LASAATRQPKKMKSQQVGAIDRFLAAAPLEAAANHDGGRDKGDPEMARWVLFQQRWLTRLGPVKELVSKKCFLVIPFQNFHSSQGKFMAVLVQSVPGDGEEIRQMTPAGFKKEAGHRRLILQRSFQKNASKSHEKILKNRLL